MTWAKAIAALLFALIVMAGSGGLSTISAQAPPPAPAEVIARNGAKPGEVRLSWTAVADAQFYRVGWVAYEDYQAASEAGGEWREVFAFVDVANRDQTSHTITRLTPGTDYAFIVASNGSRYGEPRWSEWALLAVRGDPGACPAAQQPTDADTDRVALVGLYHAAGGRDWTDNTNWVSAAPVGEWYGVTTDDDGRVIGLVLRENRLTGTIPPVLGDLAELETLDFSNGVYSCSPEGCQPLSPSGNLLSGEIPQELGRLGNLRRLDLRVNELSGAVPPQLANLAGLEYLDLQGNRLSGTVPSQLGAMTNLQHLYLSRNQLTGTIPWQLGSLTNLRTLWLGSNQLSGTIPPQLGDLTNLQWLDLRHNQLSGTIPSQLGSLTNLQWLWLGGNQLSGAIPPNLSDLTNLEDLSIGHNQLSGTIPSQLGSLTNLEDLALDGNRLSGVIPPQLGNLINLQHLYLNHNRLSGEIPPQLGNLVSLRSLGLGHNQMSGTIPSQLGNLVNLEHLELGGNQFSGCIPRKLRDVRLHGGSLPVCDGDLACTVHTTTDGIFAEAKWSDVPTELNGNPLTGYEVLWTISGIGGTRSEPLVRLGKSRTQTSLTVPGAATPQAVQFSLRGVYIQQSGEYIHESCVDHQLERATLVALYIATGGESWTSDHNWLSHQEVGAWSGVRTGHNGRVIGLSLHNQGLSGEMPKSLANLRNLRKLELVGNQLTGPIPVELSELTGLTSLDLSQNRLSGQMPLWLGNLRDLRELNLSGNQLTGTMPPRLGSLSRLTTLSLHSNQLSGAIPPELGMLGDLTALDLGNNMLTGTIPRELAELVELHVLALGSNKLSGEVPSELGNLTKLHTLFLDWNQLSGEIPKEWGNIRTWREWRIIAGNNFTGCIPYGMQFAPGDPGDSTWGNLPFCSQ